MYGICRPHRGYSPLKRLHLASVPWQLFFAKKKKKAHYSPASAFLGNNTRNTAEGSLDFGWDGGLHAHLDSLKWAEGNIRDELRRRTSRQVKGSLPASCSVLSDKVAVELLEEFIATVLECTLGLFPDTSVSILSISHFSCVPSAYAVSEESRAPASKHAPQAFCMADGFPALHIALVQVGINLPTALDKIQRRYRCVGQTLSQSYEWLAFPGT